MKKNDVISVIKDQKELIQDDLLCILDGLDDSILNNVCQVIVDRLEIIETTVEDHIH